MSITAQQFKDRIKLHRAGRTDLEKHLDELAYHRKSQLLRCFPGSYAKCTWGVRIWREQELLTTDMVTIVFTDPRYAWPPTKTIAESQMLQVETETRKRNPQVLWTDPRVRIEIMQLPKVQSYYAESKVKKDAYKPLLHATETRPVGLPTPGCGALPQSDPQGRRAFSEGEDTQKTQETQESVLAGNKPQSECSQTPSTQELTQGEHTPSAREVLAKLAQEAREKRKIQKS